MSRQTATRVDCSVVVHENCIFHVSSARPSVVYYKCKVKKCPATGVVRDGGPFLLRRGHQGHEPEQLIQLKNKFLTALKRRAQKEFLPLRHIYDEEAAKPEFRNVSQTVGFGAVVRTLESVRRGTIPPIPQTMEDLANLLSSPDWRKYAFLNRDPNTKFYQGYFEHDDIQVAFFGDDDLIRQLGRAKHIHIDGTFKSVPKKPKS